MHHSQKSGIWVGHSSFGKSYDITITGNQVFNNVLENQHHASRGGWSQAIGIQRSDRVTVTGNKVYRNDGEGIVFVLSDNGVATLNEVFDNFSVGIYLDNAQSTRVNRNFVYSTGDSRYFRDGYPAHGIGIANETYSDTNPVNDLTITNNIILRSRYGIYYGNYENGGGLKNSVIANNTVYDATHAMLSIAPDAHSGSSVENNIFFQASGRALAQVSGSGITYRSNSWNGGSPGAAAGVGDIVGNPQLVNAGGTKTVDYQLASWSPLVDRGITSARVRGDFWGSERAGNFDIGAHELRPTESADVIPPSTPAGLSATATSSSAVTLRWNASHDNVAVTSYKLFRNGVLIARISSTSFNDSGLAIGTYTYRAQRWTRQAMSLPSATRRPSPPQR